MADFGRWRDAAGEPAADRAVHTDRPEPPEQPERASAVDGHPGLRDLYADDPDDIFDPDTDTGTDTGTDTRPDRDVDTEPDAHADPDRDAGAGERAQAEADAGRPASEADRDADGEPGERPAGEPPPDGPDRDDPDGTGPDDTSTEPADTPLTVVDRPVTPENRDGGYGMDLTLTPREGRFVRPVLFDGPPSREQAVQGDLGDCGVIAALGAVAGRRPDAIRDVVSQRPDGGYLVRLHQVEPDQRGVFVPTGERIHLAVTPELPLRRGFEHYAAFADTYRTGVSWAAVLEKALAGVDDTWSQAHAADRAGTSGYERLDLGSRASDQAEWLAMLTGQPATPVALDRTPGQEPAVERWLRGHLDAGNPVLACTEGDGYGPLPQGLVDFHAYEVLGVDDGRIWLHNPWGDRHPPPMTVRDFLDSTNPLIATTWDRETR